MFERCFGCFQYRELFDGRRVLACQKDFFKASFAKAALDGHLNRLLRFLNENLIRRGAYNSIVKRTHGGLVTVRKFGH